MAASKPPSSSSSSKKTHFTFSFIILSISLLLLTVNCLRRLENQYPTRVLPRVVTRAPKWLDIISSKENIDKKSLKIALVNVNGDDDDHSTLHGVENTKKIHFSNVSNDVEWKDLFPEWIDENVPWMLQGCPKIPMPNLEDYDDDFNVVVAKLPCDLEKLESGKGVRDVFRLQVNLVVANLLVRSGWRNGGGGGGRRGAVYGVFIGSGGQGRIQDCSPMWEIFRCDDLIWNEGNVWIYKPDLRRLNEKVMMPVGTCQLAPPVHQDYAGQERFELSNKNDFYKQREAYVTVLHSSEAYVCGAIALAQSIIKSNSTKDLVLLADDSLSPNSLHGLKSAGWKIKSIERIHSPRAKKNAYNEWNYSKLRLWQLTDYDKVIFIDADFILLRNIDEFFKFPQLSAAGNDKYLFNSGVMLIEPSQCTFDKLMQERFNMASYNGGDQGYLNEMFTWWHRWPAKLNHLKFFGDSSSDDKKHGVPENIYALHYLGLKPWMCYQDYDCNWDKVDYHKYASDLAHAKWWNIYKTMPRNLKSYCGLTPIMDSRIRKWRGKAKNANLVNGHWKIKVRDPRRFVN